MIDLCDCGVCFSVSVRECDCVVCASCITARQWAHRMRHAATGMRCAPYAHRPPRARGVTSHIRILLTVSDVRDRPRVTVRSEVTVRRSVLSPQSRQTVCLIINLCVACCTTAVATTYIDKENDSCTHGCTWLSVN